MASKDPIDPHTLRWKHVEYLGRGAGKLLEKHLHSFFAEWIRNNVISKSQAGLVVSEHGPTEEYVTVARVAFRQTIMERLLRRQKTEVVYVCDLESCGGDATEAVHKSLKTVYPEGKKVQFVHRSKIRTLGLKLGAKGEVELNGVPISEIKGNAAIDGTLLVGSTKFDHTQRPPTRSLSMKIKAIEFEKCSSLVILDNIERFMIKSLSSLTKAIKASPSAKLLMLTKKDIDERQIGFCDKLRICYDPAFTNFIPENSDLLEMLTRDSIDHILKVAEGVPSRARRVASVIYGDRIAQKRKLPAKLDEITEVLRNWNPYT